MSAIFSHEIAIAHYVLEYYDFMFLDCLTENQFIQAFSFLGILHLFDCFTKCTFLTNLKMIFI